MEKSDSNAKKIFKVAICLIVFSMIMVAFGSVAFAQENNSQNEVLNTGDYILKNINTEYAKAEKLEPYDIIDVKQTMADGSKLTSSESLEAMFSETPEAFIFMSEAYMPMYNTDDASPYYVAYIDTMHNDANSKIAEVDFAYTNTDGEVITDAIFDSETGIAYIPKKYTEENKNGLGIMNVQVQLLQVCNSENPSTTIKTIVEKGEGIEGETIETGYVQLNAIDTDVTLSVAKDENAKRSIQARDIVVKKNGYETKNFTYNSEKGEIRIVDCQPCSVDTIEISLNKDNNNDEIQDTAYGIATVANGDPLSSTSDFWNDDPYAGGTFTSGTTWKSDKEPLAGGTVRVSGISLLYHEGDGNRIVDSQYNQAYVPGKALDDDLTKLVTAIRDNVNNIDPTQLVGSTNFMSWTLDIPEGTQINYEGTTFTIPQSSYEVRCAHSVSSFTSGTSTTYSDMEIKLFAVNPANSTMLVGVLAPFTHNQSGTALYKIRYEMLITNGKIVVHKRESLTNNPIEGVTFNILNDNGDVVDTITTNGDGYAETKNLPAGHYRCQETGVPADVILSGETQEATISAESLAPELTFVDDSTAYAQIEKKDEYGDSLAGVRFQIYDSKQQPIQVITTGDNGIAKTTALKLGDYYYQEISVPADDIIMDTEMHPFQLRVRGRTESFSMRNSYERGNMKVIKKDEWDVRIQGAVFHISGGPEKEPIDADYTTDSNGEISLTDLRLGEYTIVEKNVPETLTLNQNTFTVNVEADSEVTYTVKNEYARGELSITKEDIFKQDGKKNWGDATYKDIEVELHAAEDIYEGKTKVLDADEFVAKRVFKTDGTTESVREFTRQGDGVYFDGLPIGQYYWKEVKTNKAYLAPQVSVVAETKKEKYEQEIEFVDMLTHDIPGKSVVMYDQPVMGRVEVYKQDESSKTGPDDTTHSETNPAEGAVLRLTLKSNWNEVTEQPIDPTHDTYTATVNKYGKAVFINPEFEQFHMEERGMDPNYTIPYGVYVLSEDKTSDDGGDYFYGIQATDVYVEENDTPYYVIVKDNPIPVFLEIVKKDADTDDDNGAEKEIVSLPDAKFKIWDCSANEGKGGWLVQELSSGSAVQVDEFMTNEEGYLITPKKLYAGKYIIYETKAPKGYYLNEKYRVPEDESKLGDEKYGGLAIDITNAAVFVGDAEQYPDIGEVPDYEWIDDHLKITVSAEDNTLRGNIDLYKEGEMFSRLTENTTNYRDDGFDEDFTEYIPEYEYKGLEGCKFEVSPVDDVKTADGRLKEAAGTKHYIVTGEDGHGICRKDEGTGEEDLLFCNPDGSEYLIHEVECPAGYEPCKDFTVTVKPGDQYTKVKVTDTGAKDDYIPVEVRLDKEFEKENEEGKIYSNVLDTHAVAIFGIYASQDLVAANGQELPADTLIQTLRVVEGEGFIDTYKLPDGQYYLDELYTTEPYTIIDNETDLPHRYEFTVTHSKGVYEEQKILIEAINTFPKGDLYVVKVSDTGVEQAAGITVKGDDETRQRVKDFIEQYNNTMQLQIANGDVDLLYAVDQTVQDFKVNDEFTLTTPAVYGVYLDKECTQPLQYSYSRGGTFINVTLDASVNEDGMLIGSYSALGLPVGEYYVKELRAPIYTDNNGTPHEYEVSDDVEMVQVMDSDFADMSGENIIFRVFTDTAVKSQMDKRDMFTGKGVPNCHFTITDENGNELLDFVTLEDGTSEIPTDIFEDGKYYYFTELEAPGFPYYDGDTLYELNTEPHKFRVEYEDNTWKFYGRNQDEYGNEYGEEVENPVLHNFRPRTDIELQKLDMMDSTPVPNCKFRLESKEIDFVVEGVTDENGIYLFKDVPYGEYTYTELEAPEEYLIDTTPHDFTHDSHGTKIVVYDERAVDVDTGDIAVMAIAGIALVSVIGIVFLVVKKKASSK